uniref:Uncharacterized protein n=1 Tax=Rhizophora mucronata TaxID=61149 RepID=A0A2P2QYC9_RHIMU
MPKRLKTNSHELLETSKLY